MFQIAFQLSDYLELLNCGEKEGDFQPFYCLRNNNLLEYFYAKGVPQKNLTKLISRLSASHTPKIILLDFFEVPIPYFKTL